MSLERFLAFSTYRLFILTAKIPTKIDANFHYLDIKSIESKRPNQSVEVCNEILHVIKKNSVIESLFLSNTGISTEFVKRLSTTAMVDTQLQRLDLSNNLNIDDFGAEYLIGALSSRGKQCTYLDLTGTKVTSKGLNKVAEAMNRSPHVFSALQTLKLSTVAAGKSDDLQSMYAFLASPTMLNHLDLSGTEVEIDKLMTPLQRGCSQNLTTLKLSRVAYSRRTKDVVVQSSFKQFFATVVTLKLVDLSYVRIPPEALKDLFLGITSNRNLKDVHVDITGCEVTAVGVQTLTNCLPSTQNIARLDLTGLVKGQNSALNERELVVESLSLADSKLKDSMNMIINALGSNMSLTEIDISGNQMGDLGARMLSKALQINNKLRTIVWDKNNTTCLGFEDVALALEKSYTLHKMPIERLLQRNHSPQKYSSDQAYRLQQGFLISSTQQTVDRLVVQTQDTINALSLTDSLQPYTNAVQAAKVNIADADNSKTLLPQLYDIAIQSQKTGNDVSQKLNTVAEELKTVLENQMKKTVREMLEITVNQCSGIMTDPDSPKLMQRKSYARKIRPQSVIDKAVVQQALDAEKKSSLDPISQGSHSPRSGSRSPSTDGSCDREHVRSHDRVDQSKSSSKSRSSKSDSPTPQKPVKVPRSRPKKSKSKTSSQVALDSSASKASIPKIEVTSADGNDLDPDPLYDNAPDVRGSPRCHRSNIVPDKEVELDVVPELPEYGKLTHVTKDRARVKRNVDEGVDNFFSKASSTPTTPVSNGPDSGNKTPSSGGFSLFGKKTPPKPSPTSKRVSDVKETEEDEEDFVPSKERKPSSGDTSSQNSNQNNGSESGSIKGSLERKFDKSAQKLSGSSLERGSSPRVSSERGQKSSGIALERSQSPRVSFGKGQKGPNNSEETPEEAKNDEKKTKSDSEDSDAEHENGESQKVVGLKKSDSTSSSGSEKVAKKPLKVPMKLKSVEKPVEKEVESDIDETEEAKTEEKEEKEAATTVKDDKEKVDDKTEEEKKE
ncbi:CARL1-like protein, partial [Mya arenaria]